MTSTDDILGKQFLFIIGSPRSGTTWLHTLLSAHESVGSIVPSELTHFSTYLPPLIKTWERQKENVARFRQGLPAVWSDDEFEKFLRNFTADVYRKLLEKRPGATHILDKHPNYSNFVPVIRCMLPNARFIHVIRDGRDVVISSKSANARDGFMHEDVRVMAKKWKSFTQHARAAKKDGNYLEVKYEDLLANTHARVEEIFRFCGLPVAGEFVSRIVEENNFGNNPVSSSNASINAIRGDKEKLYGEQLTLEERYIFTLIAGDLLKELGYADGDDWIFTDPQDKLRLLSLKMKYKFKKGDAK